MQRFSLRTRDPDVASAAVNELFGSPLGFQDEPAKEFHCDLDGFVTTGAFTAARITLPAHTRIDSGEIPAYSVSYARSGTTQWVVGSQEGSFDVPLLLPPRRRLEMSNAGHHSDTVSLGFSPETIERYIGASEHRVASGAALSSPRNASAALGSFLSYVGSTLDAAPELFEIATVRAGLFDAAISLVLAGFGLGRDVDSSSSSPMPRSLRRAISFIDDNLANAVSVVDIASAARLSVRGLQGLFERELGVSPTRYLRRARLHAARHELLSADSGSTRVAEVAQRWGFAHLPRFAQEYRAEFGELPSTTLQG